MNIIHYSPKSKGIRFFRSATSYLKRQFSDQTDMIIDHWDDKDFLSTLETRQSNLDLVFIFAHGWEDAILKSRRGEFKRSIELRHAKYFNSKFVLANSCYTAKVWGPELIANGTLAYIGFDDSIEPIFRFDHFEGRNLNEALSIIFKHVYNKVLIDCIEIFVKDCRTAQEFTEFLDLKFRLEIKEISKLNMVELRKVFAIPVKEENFPRLIKAIKLAFISKLDFLNERIVLLGEENYIPWFFLKNMDEASLNKTLKKIDGITEKTNNYYKYFVKLLIYAQLNDHKNYLINYGLFNSELEKRNAESDTIHLPFEISDNLEQTRIELSS
ncbi:hypothetical protein LCM10_18570 [Rossellomorea aquimaris]|uniref:hypothetical protein n=1 Tax=Rossellomorea aquimaris TaxID=189382 RepID=UPI001CD794CD|nr:hypothetical protein [Rossellomorea aquimaris]MCA1056971.1 hypothetical protein [Rossellomorea aquimaris]